MADNHSDGEGNFRSQSKYKQFSAAVERALKSFEVSSEWPDLISSLARLNKVLLAYRQYPAVPHQLTVCKRLTQCLHPNLPGGVHIKVLDVYRAIFERIGTKGLASDLLVYSSGLFPLLGHASMSVRPCLLDVYEKYYLPLGVNLIPCLHGMVLGLMPGLEDESEHTDRIINLLDALCEATEQSAFFGALWQCVLHSPSARLPACTYILSKLSKKLTAEDQPHCLGDNLPFVVSALCAALLDGNVLVARAALDIISILFPLHQPFLLPSDVTLILSAALETLLKRDASLNRRLYAWLLGSQVDKSYLATRLPQAKSTDESNSNVSYDYFKSFSRAPLIAAIKRLVSQATTAAKSSVRAECVLPYRLLRALMDKPEIGDAILQDVLVDIVSCLKQQVEALGGPQGRETGNSKPKRALVKDDFPRKLGKKGSLKAEVLQAATLFFNVLTGEVLWDWMGELLVHALREKSCHSLPASAVSEDQSMASAEDVMEGDPELEGALQKSLEAERFVTVTPDSEHSSTSHSSQTRGNDSPASLSVPSAVGLVHFLLLSLPLDSMENVHQFYLPKLLQSFLQELATGGVHLPLSGILPCLELTLFVTHELLSSPTSQMSSHANTPHTPSTPLPRAVGGQLFSSVTEIARTPQDGHESFHHEREDSIPAFLCDPLGEMKQQSIAQYLEFFATFVGSRIYNSKSEGKVELFLPKHVVGGPDTTSRNLIPIPEKTLPQELQTSFTTACQLLLQISQLGGGGPGSRETVDSPSWLTVLMSACVGCRDIHVTFVAVETVLRLLELYHEAPSTEQQLLPRLGERSATTASLLSLLTDEDISYIATKTTFVQSVSSQLWVCLSPTHPHLHIEAATLITWLHSLMAPATVCERILLEDFAVQGLSAYRKYATLWQYTPAICHHTITRPFNRALLRMLEGLRSQSTAVKCFVRSWLKFATERAELGRVLHPLLRILVEAELGRARTPSKQTDKALSSYGKYYYAGEYHDLEEKKSEKDEFESISLQYSQVFDASRVLYALSLICSVIAADPGNIVGCLGSAVVDVSTYTGPNSSGQSCLIATKFHSVPLPSSNSISNPAPHSETQTPATPSPAPKSLLELLLASCVDFLRSEYQESLEASLPDQLNNQRVRTAATELISVLLRELVLILSQHESTGPANTSMLQNPSYVSALVTLCDTQKVTLLVLARVVQNLRDTSAELELREDSSKSPVMEDSKELNIKGNKSSPVDDSSTDEDKTSLETLFVHLLRCVQNLITLDAQCNPATPASATLLTPNLKNPDISISQLPPILASLPTASQPLFQVLLLNILANSSLVHMHRHLLCMFAASLPNLRTHLDELAPKVLKQICRNLERAFLSEKEREGHKSSRKYQRDSQLLSSDYIISYLESLVIITLWCLFGERPTDSNSGTTQGQLNHRSLNMFWNGTTYTEAEDPSDILSPTSKQPSTMAWLFGVFTTSQRSSPSEGGGKVAQVGVDSRVGQYILMLLPAVYNAITDVWKYFSSRVSTAAGGGSGSRFGHGGQPSTAGGQFGLQEDVGAERRKRMEFEDVQLLISQLLCPLAERESCAFFSSVSQVWLEWNLESKVQASKRLAKKKDSFTDMLHQVQVLPLERFLRCVQFTLSDIAHSEDFESGILRQKYLLHFLYKYISSTLQCSEELAGCRAALVAFLRECYTQNYTTTSESLFASCHILCMLTSILHVFVCRVATPEQKKQKKERKELQDITQKLCEALSTTARASILQDYAIVEKADDISRGDDQPTQTQVSHPVLEEAKDSSTSGDSNMRGKTAANGVPETDRSGSSSPVPLQHKDGISVTTSSSSGDAKVAETQDKIVAAAKQTSSSNVEHSPSPASSQKSGVSAASVRAGIDTSRRSNQLHTPPLMVVAKQPSVSMDQQMPATQALAVLANVLSHFIDCVFGSSEKDKVYYLLKAVLYNMWPHLQNHSPEARQCYRYAVKLLSSLSEFQITRKAWRRETLDLFLSPDFFLTDLDSLREWKVIVDNLMTQDKVTFRDLLSRLHYPTATGVNIFSSLEYEALNGARLLKRVAFAILSGEMDQYVSYLPDIQEKLSDCLKFQKHPILISEVFICFRVLLLKLSPSHLLPFWPAMITELLAVLEQMELDLLAELRSHTPLPQWKLQLYFSACKLLDTTCALPTEFLPHFQFLHWGFGSQELSAKTPASSAGGCLALSRLHQHYSLLKAPGEPTKSKGSFPGPPYLCSQTISSLKELKPLFDALHGSPATGGGTHSHTPNLSTSREDAAVLASSNPAAQLARVEQALLQDFLTPF